MCVGALLESDVEALVYALANDRNGAAGTVIQLAQHDSLRRRIKVVSGIRRDEALALFAGRRPSPEAPGRTRRAGSDPRFGILPRGEVSEWLMVPLSKSGVRKHRGFESRPLRHYAPRSPALAAFAPARLAHAPWGALAPVLGRGLARNRHLGEPRAMTPEPAPVSSKSCARFPGEVA